MSITSCVECGVFIDTDKHPECYIGYSPYCSGCMPEVQKDYTAQVAQAMNEPEENDDEPFAEI